MGAKFAIMLAMAIMSFCGICEEMPGDININNKGEIIESVLGENQVPEIILDERSEIDVPILMYHHITPEASTMFNTMTITPECFEKHMIDIIEFGYTPIFLEELISYVESGEKLPEKPICITFDDGYLSNYEYAFPILKKYNIKANIAVIGATIGLDKYKNTENPIIPHFNLEQAREMEGSKLVSIISHTYDMHQSSNFESGDKIRTDVIKLSNETEEEYKNALRDDHEKISQILLKELEKKTEIVAYPYGRHSEISNQTLKELGVKMTLATSTGINKIEKGKKECLYNLHRYTIHENS